MSNPDESLILAQSVLERPHDPDSALAMLARGLIRHHSASVALQVALKQSLTMEAHYVRLLTGSAVQPG